MVMLGSVYLLLKLHLWYPQRSRQFSPPKTVLHSEKKWSMWQLGDETCFFGSLAQRGVCSLTLKKSGPLSAIMKMDWLPPPFGEGPNGKDYSTQGRGNGTLGWKGSYCFLSTGTFSIKESPLRWSITSLSDKEIITIKAAPLHISCPPHAVDSGEKSIASHLQPHLCEHGFCSYGYQFSAGSWSFYPTSYLLGSGV